MLPTKFGTRVEQDPAAGKTQLIGVAEFETAQLLSVPGSGPVLCDRLEVHAVRRGLQKVGMGTLILNTANTSQGLFLFSDGHVH